MTSIDYAGVDPKKMTNNQMRKLWFDALDAGMEAAEKCNPTPMVVGHETSPFSGVIDTEKDMYYVDDGVCGFAWVSITPGNSRFANYLKKAGLARKDSYYGGVTVWIGEYGQSYERKMAHAGAMAKVFYDAGIDATPMGRMD